MTGSPAHIIPCHQTAYSIITQQVACHNIFKIQVGSRATTILNGAEQHTSINFDLTLTDKISTHELELDNIQIGGMEQLVPSKRYYFKAFKIEVAPLGG